MVSNVVIDEQISAAVINETQSPHKQRRYLTTRHIRIRTEHVIGRRVTPERDIRRRQLIDIGLELRPIIINKQIPAAVIVEAQSPHKERRQHPPGDMSLRTEHVVGWRVASHRDPLRVHPLDIVLELRRIVINEWIQSRDLNDRNQILPSRDTRVTQQRLVEHTV